MKPGPLVRRLFGPFERQISELYRSIYIDIDEFVELIVGWHENPKRILEVGCGEGAVTERLSAAFHEAQITAIDISPRVGRLYRGRSDGVRFINRTVQEIATCEPGHYDLIVLSDVLHHVPIPFRQGLLDAIRVAMAPQGALIFKDWQRNRAPIHLLCYASDRWLTGDHISFMTRDEMRTMLARSFGELALRSESRVAPWWNNIATLVRP